MSDQTGAGKYAALLKGKQLKVTPTRILVLELLDAAARPQSAGAIFSRASANRPTDKVTVYRSLETFYKAGLLERTRAGGRQWLYHLIALPGRHNHPHFHCSGCGALQCLPPDTVKLDIERLAEIFPAQMDHLRISLEGVCPKCLAENG